MLYIIDTADLEAIKHINEFYPVDGVTTNPSIIAKEKTDCIERLREIRRIIGEEKILCAQTLQTDAGLIVEEGKKLQEAIGGNFYLKVPIGEAGLKATMELKKLGNMCDKYGVAMAIHMAESPIACMAAIHAAAAVQNCLAVEFHSVDIPWWNDLAIGIDNPLFKDGFVNVPNKPGLGIDELNEELIAEHMHEKYPGIWEPTTEWDKEWANDREWS